MDITGLVEKVVGSLDEKRRYRAYRERVKNLPAPYRTATEGVERYLLHYGAIVRGGVLVAMLEDLADLFEQAAAAQSSIDEVVGADPAEFADDFLRNYSEGQWYDKERRRLAETIERARQQEEQ